MESPSPLDGRTLRQAQGEDKKILMLSLSKHAFFEA
jgi:hypothetical protein